MRGRAAGYWRFDSRSLAAALDVDEGVLRLKLHGAVEVGQGGV